MTKTISQKYMDDLYNDPARLKVFYRAVMGPPHTELTGKEYEEVKLMLALSEPYKSTNNQHAWTDYYKIGDTEYHVTSWGSNEPPTIVEYLPE